MALAARGFPIVVCMVRDFVRYRVEYVQDGGRRTRFMKRLMRVAATKRTSDVALL